MPSNTPRHFAESQSWSFRPVLGARKVQYYYEMKFGGALRARPKEGIAAPPSVLLGRAVVGASVDEQEAAGGGLAKGKEGSLLRRPDHLGQKYVGSK